MNEQLPIAEVIKVALFVADLGNAAGGVMEDKKIGPGDIDDLFAAMQALRDAVSVDYSKAMKQVKDMDDDEFQQVVDAFGERFDIPADQVEARVEAALDIAQRLYAVVQDAKQWAAGHIAEG